MAILRLGVPESFIKKSGNYIVSRSLDQVPLDRTRQYKEEAVPAAGSQVRTGEWEE